MIHSPFTDHMVYLHQRQTYFDDRSPLLSVNRPLYHPRYPSVPFLGLSQNSTVRTQITPTTTTTTSPVPSVGLPSLPIWFTKSYSTSIRFPFQHWTCSHIDHNRFDDPSHTNLISHPDPSTLAPFLSPIQYEDRLTEYPQNILRSVSKNVTCK